MIKVVINDKEVMLAEGTTLHEALNGQNIKPMGIATAVNGMVIPLKSRESTVLLDGDQVVIIKAFYGG